MPQDQAPTTQQVQSANATGKRVPDHFTGTNEKEFDQWAGAFLQQGRSDAFVSFMKKPSKGLDF